MRQIRAVATNQAAAGRTVIRAAINSASGGTSPHTTAGRAAPTPPPKAPGPVATPSPGASDHLHRADANPRGSTEISRANAKFRGIHTTTIPYAMVFSQVWQTSIATACFSSFVHAPHFFHALIGTTLPVAAAGGLSQYVDQSAIGRRRFSRMSPRRARRCAAVDHTGNVAANDCAGTANGCVNSCLQPQRAGVLFERRAAREARKSSSRHALEIALLAQQRR